MYQGNNNGISDDFNNKVSSDINSTYALQGGNSSESSKMFDESGIYHNGVSQEIMDFGTLNNAVSLTESYEDVLLNDLNNFVNIMKNPANAECSLLSSDSYATAGISDDVLNSLGSEEEIKDTISLIEKDILDMETELNKLKLIKDNTGDKIIQKYPRIFDYINIYNNEYNPAVIMKKFLDATENNPDLFKEIIGITREQYSKINQTIFNLESFKHKATQEMFQLKYSLILKDAGFKAFECENNDYSILQTKYKEITDEIFSVITEEEKKMLMYIECGNATEYFDKKSIYIQSGESNFAKEYIVNMMDLWNKRAAEKRCQERLDELIFNYKDESINKVFDLLVNNQNNEYNTLRCYDALCYQPDDYQKNYQNIVFKIYALKSSSEEIDEQLMEEVKNSIPTPEQYRNDYYRIAQQLYDQRIAYKFKEYKDEEITQENYKDKILELLNIFDIDNDNVLYKLGESSNYNFLINQAGYELFLEGFTPEKYKEHYEIIKERARQKLLEEGIIVDVTTKVPSPEEFEKDYYSAAMQMLYEKKFYENENFASVCSTYCTGIQDGVITWGEGFYNVFNADGKISIEQYERMLYANYLNQNFNYLDSVYNVGSATGNMLPTITISLLLSHGLGLFTSMSAQTASSVANVTSQAIMGLTTYGNTMDQTLSEGYSKEVAALYSLSIAGSEVLMEKFLGGILGLGDNVAKGIVAEMFQEGCEETITTLIQDGILSQMILGKTLDLNELFNSFGEDFLVSMLVAGSLNTYTNTMSNFIVDGRLYTLSQDEYIKVLNYKENNNVSIFEAIVAIKTQTPDSLESTTITTIPSTDESLENTSEEEIFVEKYDEIEQIEETIEPYSSIDNITPDIEENYDFQEEFVATSDSDIFEESSTTSETLEESTLTQELIFTEIEQLFSEVKGLSLEKISNIKGTEISQLTISQIEEIIADYLCEIESKLKKVEIDINENPNINSILNNINEVIHSKKSKKNQTLEQLLNIVKAKIEKELFFLNFTKKNNNQKTREKIQEILKSKDNKTTKIKNLNTNYLFIEYINAILNIIEKINFTEKNYLEYIIDDPEIFKNKIIKIIIGLIPNDLKSNMDNIIKNSKGLNKDNCFYDKLSSYNQLLVYNFLYDNSDKGKNLEKLISNEYIEYEIQNFILSQDNRLNQSLTTQIGQLYQNSINGTDEIYSLIEEYNSINGNNFFEDFIINENNTDFDSIINSIIRKRKETLDRMLNNIKQNFALYEIEFYESNYEELLRSNIYTSKINIKEYICKYILNNILISNPNYNSALIDEYNYYTKNTDNNTLESIEELILSYAYNKNNKSTIIENMINATKKMKKEKIITIAESMGINVDSILDDLIYKTGPHTSDKRIRELLIENIMQKAKSQEATISKDIISLIAMEIKNTFGENINGLTKKDIQKMIEQTGAKESIAFSSLVNDTIYKILSPQIEAYNNSLSDPSIDTKDALKKLRAAQATICGNIAKQLTNNYNNTHKGNEISERFLSSVIPHILMFDEAKGQDGGGHYQSPLLYPYKLDNNQNITKYDNNEGNISYYKFYAKNGKLVNKTFWPSNYSFQEIVDTLMYTYNEVYDKSLGISDKIIFKPQYQVINDNGVLSHEKVKIVTKKPSSENNFTEYVVTFYPEGSNSTASTNQTTNP